MKLKSGKHRMEVLFDEDEAEAIDRAAQALSLGSSTWVRSLVVQQLDRLYPGQWRRWKGAADGDSE